MSGGSHDYVYRDIEGLENINKVVEHIPGLVASLRRRLAEPVDQLRIKHTPGAPWRRPATERERLIIDMGGAALIARFLRLEEKINDMRRQLDAEMSDLARLAHELEWADSGDTTTDSVHTFIVAWCSKRLGVDLGVDLGDVEDLAR